MTKKATVHFGSNIEFANFGKSTLAYVRQVSRDEMDDTAEYDAAFDPTDTVWGLFAADGEPIALSDKRASLIENAGEMQLVPVGLH